MQQAWHQALVCSSVYMLVLCTVIMSSRGITVDVMFFPRRLTCHLLLFHLCFMLFYFFLEFLLNLSVCVCECVRLLYELKCYYSIYVATRYCCTAELRCLRYRDKDVKQSNNGYLYFTV